VTLDTKFIRWCFTRQVFFFSCALPLSFVWIDQVIRSNWRNAMIIDITWSGKYTDSCAIVSEWPIHFHTLKWKFSSYSYFRNAKKSSILTTSFQQMYWLSVSPWIMFETDSSRWDVFITEMPSADHLIVLINVFWLIFAAVLLYDDNSRFEFISSSN
jgi:hypothetical protein